MARKRIEWTPEQISRALTLRFAGQTYDAIARDMGTSTSSVYRLFQERDENEDPEHLTPHEESLVASGIYQGRTPEDIALEIGKNARVVVECYKTLLKLCPGMEGGLEEGPDIPSLQDRLKGRYGMISTKAPSSNLRDGNPEQSPKLYSVVPWDDTGSILPLSSLATICLPGREGHRYFLGVDPGLKGGIALLDDQLRAVWLSRMPTSSNGHDLDIHALASIISNLVLGYRIQLTLLEDPIAMPHQNVVSTLKTGEVHGITRTILELSGQGYVQVEAKEWQKAMLPEGTKAAPPVRPHRSRSLRIWLGHMH